MGALGIFGQETAVGIFYRPIADTVLTRLRNMVEVVSRYSLIVGSMCAGPEKVIYGSFM